MPTWRDEAVAALVSVGGSGTYDQIYGAVRQRRDALPKSWQAILRRTIEERSSDTESYKGLEDLFQSVDGIGKGVWALRGGVSSALDSVKREIERRKQIWAALTAAPRVDAELIRTLDLYRGQAGIFFDKAKTAGPLAPSGIALSFRHTGTSYADELSDDGLIYHYPSTSRPGSHDEGEIESARTAFRLGMPVFVIAGSKEAPNRDVRLGYIEEYDDRGKLFLVTFTKKVLSTALDERADPFDETGGLSEPTLQAVRARPNQKRFAAAVFKRYGTKCAACDFEAAGIVVAAHLRPKKAVGSDDARNGLPLCANHHVAMDRGLRRIDPSGNVFRSGPESDLRALKITRKDLSHLTAQPHQSAIEWLWAKGFKPI